MADNNLIFDIDKLLELQAKASKVDAIVAYVKSTEYSVNKDVILAIAGEELYCKKED